MTIRAPFVLVDALREPKQDGWPFEIPVAFYAATPAGADPIPIGTYYLKIGDRQQAEQLHDRLYFRADTFNAALMAAWEAQGLFPLADEESGPT